MGGRAESAVGEGEDGAGGGRRGRWRRRGRWAALEAIEVFVESAEAGPDIAQVGKGETCKGADQCIEESRSGAPKSGARQRADNRKHDTHDWIHR